jgi:hypothetical protein
MASQYSSSRATDSRGCGQGGRSNARYVRTLGLGTGSGYDSGCQYVSTMYGWVAGHTAWRRRHARSGLSCS